MKYFILLVSACVLMKPEVISSQCAGYPNGTTPDYEAIIIGRCNNYINVLQKSNCDIQAANISCKAILDEFKKVVVNKPPCSITVDSYTNLLKLASHPMAANTQTFWSGTKDVAQATARYFGYFTLETSLAGYIADDARWCSAAGKTGFEKSCPEDCVVRNNPFWVAASIDYARKAKGVATVFLNCTQARGGAATDRTIFMSYEVPAMTSAVTEVRVVCIVNPGFAKNESCSAPGTLKNLQAKLTEKKIKYSCSDNVFNNAIDTRFLLCFANSDSKECKAAKTALGA